MTLLANPSSPMHSHKHMVSLYGIHKETAAPVGPASVGQTSKVNHSSHCQVPFSSYPLLA